MYHYVLLCLIILWDNPQQCICMKTPYSSTPRGRWASSILMARRCPFWTKPKCQNVPKIGNELWIFINISGIWMGYSWIWIFHSKIHDLFDLTKCCHHFLPVMSHHKKHLAVLATAQTPKMMSGLGHLCIPIPEPRRPWSDARHVDVAAGLCHG